MDIAELIQDLMGQFYIPKYMANFYKRIDADSIMQESDAEGDLHSWYLFYCSNLHYLLDCFRIRSSSTSHSFPVHRCPLIHCWRLFLYIQYLCTNTGATSNDNTDAEQDADDFFEGFHMFRESASDTTVGSGSGADKAKSFSISIKHPGTGNDDSAATDLHVTVMKSWNTCYVM